MGLPLTRRVVGACLLVGAALVAACGGGGSASPPPGAAPPTITGQPASVSVASGQGANFTVTADGSAPLTYQWRRDGVDISGAAAASYAIASTVVGDNAARFTVVVSNAAGSVTSAEATLTVSAASAAPSITSQPAAATVAAGATASFSVTAAGSAPLAYQWRRNAANIAGANAASYVTPATSVGDDGARFSVVVSNALGSVTSGEAVLTVTATAPPPPARYVPVWSSADTTSGSGSYTLSVVDPVAPGSLITVDQVATTPANLAILRVRGGSYDAAAGSLSDVGVRNLVYVKDGSLYRVNLDKGGATPAPLRLSNEAGGPQTLGIVAVSASGDDALIRYLLPQNGGVRYVGLSATSTSAPRTAPVFPGDSGTFALVGWATDPTTGAITTLYWESSPSGGGRRLFRTDASFGNATSVATFASTINKLWFGIGVLDGGRMRHGMFFIADGALRRLDFASGNLRVVHGGVTAGGGVFDDTHVYLLLQTASARQLVRAADDDSSPGQVISADAALAGYIGITNQTRDHLLFITGAAGETAVSVRKTDGLFTPLPPPSPPAGLTHSWTTAVSLSEGTVGNRVFYHFPGRIGSINADGTDRREHSGYFTVTLMAPAALPPHRLHASDIRMPAARILVQRGSALTWLELATGDLGVTVGNSPGVATFGNEPSPYHDYSLGRSGAIGYQAHVQTSPGTTVGRLDAIYLTDQAGSLLRLTNNIP